MKILVSAEETVFQICDDSLAYGGGDFLPVIESLFSEFSSSCLPWSSDISANTLSSVSGIVSGTTSGNYTGDWR